MSGPEAIIEQACRKLAERRGHLFLKFNSGTAGVPDRIIITKDGKVMFVEFKAPHGVVSPIQTRIHAEFAARGVKVNIVRSVAQFEYLLP